MIMKAFRVTGLALALDGSEDRKPTPSLQGTEAGAEDHDIDTEPEEDEDPFASYPTRLWLWPIVFVLQFW